MVKKQHYLPLSIFLALGAFGAYGSIGLAMVPPMVSLAFFALMATGIAVAATSQALLEPKKTDATHSGAVSPTVFSAKPGKNLAYISVIAIGAAMGICSHRAREIAQRPLTTLLPANKITTVECCLQGDPLPYGTERFRVVSLVRSVGDDNGGRYSATGTIELIIPTRYGRANQPGSLTESVDGCLSKGIITEFTGFMGMSTQGEYPRFAVSSWNGPSRWSSVLFAYRAILRQGLARRLMTREGAGGLLLALLSGNRGYLAPNLDSRFRAAGLSHVLALSGMHLSIIGLLVVRVGKRLGNGRLSVRLSLVAMFFFVWFAGPSPSLVRAIIMAVSFFWSRSRGLKASPIAILALTGTAQLVLYPDHAGSPAFILSYGALLGILTLSGPLSTLMPPLVPAALRAGLGASIAAQIPTCGYTAAAFGVFVPFGFIAALPVGALATLFLSTGIVWLGIYSVIPGLGIALAPLMDAQYWLIDLIVTAFSRLPSVQIRDLSGVLATVILSITAAFATLAAHSIARKGRLPDAGFTGL